MNVHPDSCRQMHTNGLLCILGECLFHLYSSHLPVASVSCKQFQAAAETGSPECCVTAQGGGEAHFGHLGGVLG